MNSKRALFGLLALAGWLVLSPATSQAVPLSDLFQGATITADDKIFRDWTLIDLQTTNGGVADITQIDVTSLVDDPLNPGVKFSAPVGALGTPFGHTGSSSVDLVFSFNTQTDDGLPLIKDNSLLINGWVFDAGPDAFIRIAEEVYDVAGNRLGDKLAIVRNGDLPGNPNHFDSAVFAPQAFVHVVKIVHIEGPGDNDGAFLTMFEQRFSQVPEPSSLVLASAVLVCGLASGIWRRRY